MESPPDNKGVRKLLSSVERQVRHRPRDAAAGDVPAPPIDEPAESVAAPPEGSPAETAAEKDEEHKGGVPFFRKASFKERLSKAFSGQTPAEEGADIPRWSGKRFGLTPEQAKRELDPRNQMSRLLDQARNRPLLSSAILGMILLIIVMDLLVIFKKLNMSHLLAVSVTLDNPTIEGFWTWEKRTSALAYLTGDGKVVQDATTKSAVSGEEKLPKEKWEKPAAKGGLAGIIAPEDIRQDTRSGIVSGLDQYVAGQGGDGLGRTMITQADSISSPYAGKKVPTGVFLGSAGEDLSNFAPVKNPVKPSGEFLKATNAGFSEKAPQGVHGEDLVAALASEDLAQALADYQKNGQWVLHATPAGAKPIPHELGKFSMKGNEAVIQLVETKASTDMSLDCGSCVMDSRIHNARATFYGEKHQ